MGDGSINSNLVGPGFEFNAVQFFKLVRVFIHFYKRLLHYILGFLPAPHHPPGRAHKRIMISLHQNLKKRRLFQG